MRGCCSEQQFRHLARRWWAFRAMRGEKAVETPCRRPCSSQTYEQTCSLDHPGSQGSSAARAPSSSPALLAPFLAAPPHTSFTLGVPRSTRGLRHHYHSHPRHAAMSSYGGASSLAAALCPPTSTTHAAFSAFSAPPCHVMQRAAFHASARSLGGDGVEIPVDRLTITFVRSSGPGGQNVNKLNTKAELRFHVPTADWIPEPVRLRLMEQQKHRINRAGELVLTSQDHRTQARNRDECLYKLEDFLDQAFPEPKVRKIKEGISDHTKAARREAKRHRSDIKAHRRGGGDD